MSAPEPGRGVQPDRRSDGQVSWLAVVLQGLGTLLLLWYTFTRFADGHPILGMLLLVATVGIGYSTWREWRHPGETRR